MPNRARMIVASFLTNTFSFRGSAGRNGFGTLSMPTWPQIPSGAMDGRLWADAAPYFRIFNPVTQVEKFDPEGQFIRTWIPELALFPCRCWHSLETLGFPSPGLRIELKRDYPHPIIDHQKARVRALRAYDEIKALDSPPPV